MPDSDAARSDSTEYFVGSGGTASAPLLCTWVWLLLGPPPEKKIIDRRLKLCELSLDVVRINVLSVVCLFPEAPLTKDGSRL